jgi:hypothetical protein
MHVRAHCVWHYVHELLQPTSFLRYWILAARVWEVEILGVWLAVLNMVSVALTFPRRRYDEDGREFGIWRSPAAQRRRPKR